VSLDGDGRRVAVCTWSLVAAADSLSLHILRAAGRTPVRASTLFSAWEGLERDRYVRFWLNRNMPQLDKILLWPPLQIRTLVVLPTY
jgi:hypothetical protein